MECEVSDAEEGNEFPSSAVYNPISGLTITPCLLWFAFSLTLPLFSVFGIFLPWNNSGNKNKIPFLTIYQKLKKKKKKTVQNSYVSSCLCYVLAIWPAINNVYTGWDIVASNVK